MKNKTTYNHKLSAEKFSMPELNMIKEIKKAGYIIEFIKGHKGANLLEPHKSIITGKIYNVSVASASTIKAWDNKNYPLKDWYNFIIK